MSNTKICKNCLKEVRTIFFGWKRKTGHSETCKECDKLERIKRNKLLADTIKPILDAKASLTCENCWKKFTTPEVFVLTHKNIKTKKFDLDDVLSKPQDYSPEYVVDEIEKCELLCLVCVRLKEIKDRKTL
jgi:hypothetical protein